MKTITEQNLSEIETEGFNVRLKFFGTKREIKENNGNFAPKGVSLISSLLNFEDYKFSTVHFTNSGFATFNMQSNCFYLEKTKVKEEVKKYEIQEYYIKKEEFDINFFRNIPELSSLIINDEYVLKIEEKNSYEFSNEFNLLLVDFVRHFDEQSLIHLMYSHLDGDERYLKIMSDAIVSYYEQRTDFLADLSLSLPNNMGGVYDNAKDYFEEKSNIKVENKDHFSIISFLLLAFNRNVLHHNSFMPDKLKQKYTRIFNGIKEIVIDK